MEPSTKFAFGENWQAFLEKTDLARSLDQATLHTLSFLGLPSLEGMRLVDIGCGSGLFSLAAVRLGAREVVSLDVDEQSTACTRDLHRREGSPAHWRVLHGSVLDETFTQSLGQFDVVYSWGVLHHTGNMALAIANSARMVAPGGHYYIALYNDNHPPFPYLMGRSRTWVKIKHAYVTGGPLRKKALIALQVANQFWNTTRARRNFFRMVRDYPAQRGMDWYRDVVDWVGGYPYEFATVGHAVELVAPHGLLLAKANEATGLGCHELLFRRPLTPLP